MAIAACPALFALACTEALPDPRAPGGTAPCEDETGFSVVVFLLDDARYDQLELLPLTLARLSDHAVVFDRAYVTVPLCCPERASFLSGGWQPQNTGVLTNESPRGGATLFDDGDTLATRLQAEGFATALTGKYLNEYRLLGNYVPPGWSNWAATDEADPWTDFVALMGNSTPHYSAQGEETAVSDYVSTWQGKLGAEFVHGHAEQASFLYTSFRAPHDPAEPEAQDVGSAAGYQFRGGAFEEQDISDKPNWMQRDSVLDETELAAFDATTQARVETFPSMDRAIGEVLDAIADENLSENTVVVITSDNGLLYLEHRQNGKGLGYEEAVHVPLLVYHPSLVPARSTALVAANLDLAATVADFTGIEASGEGTSLRPQLCENAAGRDHVPLQAWTSGNPPWSGLVSDQYKYIETGTGESELYDLIADPTESENIVGENAALAESLHETTAAERGLTITTGSLSLEAGTPFAQTLGTWGDTTTLHWSLVGGALPAGISLSEAGVLSGTPGGGEQGAFTVAVRDESASPATGKPQRDERELTFSVNGPDAGCAGIALWPAALFGVWRRFRRGR